MTSCNYLVENKDCTGLWLGYRVGVGVSSSNFSVQSSSYMHIFSICSLIIAPRETNMQSKLFTIIMSAQISSKDHTVADEYITSCVYFDLSKLFQ